MTSTRSYNNLGKNVRDQLHRMRSAILLLGVLYLAVGPVWFFLQMTTFSTYSSLPLLTSLYLGYFTPFYFMALALGTVGGFYVTRYQNVPQQSNFYHSLPVTRAGLYSARILALVLVQVLFLIVVTMVDVVVTLMTARHVSAELAANLCGAAGLHFCYIMLVFVLALAVSLFAGQLTANTVGQVLMTAVLHLSVPCTGAVLGAVASAFSETVGQIGLFEHLMRFNILTGFMGTIASSKDRLSALNASLVTAEDAANFAPQHLLWPPVTTLASLAFALLLLAGSYALYQRRAVEKAGDTLLDARVGSVIKALYVFLGGVVIGLFFWEVVGNTLIGFILGALIAMVVVHLICEMLYSMDVDGVRRHYISSLVGLVVALCVSLGFQTGLIDLDSRLPDASSVKGAVIAYDGENDNDYNVHSAEATDPAVIEKVMAAASQAQAKNQTDINWEESGGQDFTSVTLAYDTLFGKNTRNFTLLTEDAQAIMAPVYDDSKAQAAAWSKLSAASVDDIAECSLVPNFGNIYGGYDTYLIESRGIYGNGANNVRDEADGRARAAELLEALKEDLAQRDLDVYQSRIRMFVNMSILSTNDYGEDRLSWGNVFTIYEGDKATCALLDQWQAEGFLQDEATQLREILGNSEAIVYDPAQGNGEGRIGILDTDALVAAYLAGDLVEQSQVTRFGVPVQKDICIDLLDGVAEDETSAINGSYYLREGADLGQLTSENG